MIDIVKTLDEKGFGRGKRGEILWIKKAWLKKKYWEEGLSQSEIARIMNSSQPSVQRWMKKFNIKTRVPNPGFSGKHHSEKEKQRRRKALGGNKSPNWKGGDRGYWSRIAREVWEEYWREEVPEGYLLHHSDRDRKNNDICNIPLLTISFHTILHHRKQGGNNDKHSRSLG